MTNSQIQQPFEFGRYDLLLALIPLSFIASVSVGLLTYLTLQQAIIVAGVVSAVVVADGLFVHTPENTTEKQTESSFDDNSNRPRKPV